MNSKPEQALPLNLLFGNSPEKLETATHPLAYDTSSNMPYAKQRVRGKRAVGHSPEQIAQEFRYEQGKLYFKRVHPGRSIHKPAGSYRSDGYVTVRLQGQSYLAHRVVWCLHHGQWPTELIDHINGFRHDNRIENLRECTVAENRLNVRKTRNDSGVVGVTWAKKEGNWRASIQVNGVGINLGHFADLGDAIACRRAAERKYGFLQQGTPRP